MAAAEEDDFSSLLPRVGEYCELTFEGTVKFAHDHPAGRSDVQDGWRALRVAAPPGAPHRDHVYFVAWVPRLKSSPPQPSDPPAKVVGDFPRPLDFGDDVGYYIRKAAKDRRVCVCVTPDSTTTRAEMTAVSKMASAGPSTSHGGKWLYAQKFDRAELLRGAPDSDVDFHETFRGVGELTFRDDEQPQRELHARLRAVPAGLAMYTGGPGSGKTTFAARIAAAVARGGKRVVWTVHSNELCDDAVEALKEQCLRAGAGVRVGRLPTLATITRALTHARTAERAKIQHSSSSSSSSSSAASSAASSRAGTMAQHIDLALARAAQKEREHLAADSADSVAAAAIKMAKDQRGEFGDFWQNDPASAEYGQCVASIISLAADNFNVLVGTPVAFAQFAEIPAPAERAGGAAPQRWKPSLVVIDEAGRMPESQWWIPVSVFPDAHVLTMGDTRQLEPMSASVNESSRDGGLRWRCAFGLQRKLSVLKRAEMCGRTLAHLSNNRRNRGDIANWAARHIYAGKMRIVHPLPEDRPARAYRAFMRWVFSPSSPTASNSVAYDLRSGRAQPVGKSLQNGANRAFVLWLVYQAFRFRLPSLRSENELATVMILTPYLPQLHAYRADIDRMSESGVIKGKVLARTVDNSMSSEADLVIFDSVRTGGGVGFLQEKTRMAVATTRARGGAIVVYNSGAIAQRPGLGPSPGQLDDTETLFSSYVKAQGEPVVSFENWIQGCSKCNRPGHHYTSCPRPRPCPVCNGPHHERFCRKGGPAEDSYCKTPEEEVKERDDQPMAML